MVYFFASNSDMSLIPLISQSFSSSQSTIVSTPKIFSLFLPSMKSGFRNLYLQNLSNPFSLQTVVPNLQEFLNFIPSSPFLPSSKVSPRIKKWVFLETPDINFPLCFSINFSILSLVILIKLPETANVSPMNDPFAYCVGSSG